MTDIRRKIADQRQQRVYKLGAEEGYSVPETRTVPLVSFGTDPLLICEVKRRSPSKGRISEIPDAAVQAEIYRNRGAGHVSVLTEPDNFGGSLEDLIQVKKSLSGPGCSKKGFSA